MTDVSLEGFHRYFRSNLQTVIKDRIDAGESPFPSEELVFAEMVMNHAEEAGLCDTPMVCYWKGRVGNAPLRIAGYAAGADGSSLDLFVTHYTESDCLEDLSTSVVTSAAQECLRFLAKAAHGNLEARIDPSHPVRNLVTTIRSEWDVLDRLRIFVLTDGRVRARRFSAKEVDGTIVAIEVMDMVRLYRHAEGKPRDELAISLVQTVGRPLPCVHVSDPEADYSYALTAVPGQVIKGLYERFGPRLLEANVRTFLGVKRKANKGIVDTLRQKPEHFLAYNNGLVIVCDEAAFEKTDDGGIGLSFLKGLQVVNGGQTTSAIYFASRDNRAIDLSHVMVPAKIIILSESDNDNRECLIRHIAEFSNSQSTIRLSDLSANRPFHIQLEGLANEVWCPDGATRWFYERASGAYNVLMLREGTPARRRRLREEIPPKRKLTKNDVAKYHEAWRGKPCQVAMGGEKNFTAFMKALDGDSGIVLSDGRSAVAKRV